jgi:hypothetical protein
VERFLLEPDRPSESSYGVASLEMGIKNDFGHGQYAARLQGINNRSQGCFPVWNLAQYRHQQRPVKLIAAQFAIPRSGLEKSNICEVCRPSFFPGSLEHTGLDIHGHYFALLADLPGDRDGKAPGTTADIQYRLARLKIQALNNDRCSIGFVNGCPVPPASATILGRGPNNDGKRRAI